MIGSEAMATIVVAAVGMAISWCAWVSVTMFKHAQEIALIKQEIKILVEVKEVLDDIKNEMKFRNGIVHA